MGNLQGSGETVEISVVVLLIPGPELPIRIYITHKDYFRVHNQARTEEHQTLCSSYSFTQQNCQGYSSYLTPEFRIQFTGTLKTNDDNS